MLHPGEPLPGANGLANEILWVQGESGPSTVSEQKSLLNLSAVSGDSADFSSVHPRLPSKRSKVQWSIPARLISHCSFKISLMSHIRESSLSAGVFPSLLNNLVRNHYSRLSGINNNCLE